MRRLLFILPAVLFLVLLGALYWGLNPNRDPNELPSVLINKPAPSFALPDLYGQGEVDQSVLADDEIKLVNFFASWCLPCLAEHPLLTALAQDKGVKIIGIAWKDKAEDSKNWLEKHGNPYEGVLHDLSGRTGIDWGVYGVPETYVVDGKGQILFRHPGPVTPEVLSKKLMPLLKGQGS